MKKKVIITLLAGFVALISGLIICGIGYFTGGIEDITDLSTPPLIEKTYQDIRELHLDAGPRTIQIEPSPDEQFHVRYADIAHFVDYSLTLSQEKQTLTIQRQQTRFHISGIMQFLGQELAIHRNHELQELVISVPKGKTLETLSGWGYGSSISLNNVRIKHLDWGGYINCDNVTMEGGTISSSNIGGLYFANSHLKNMKIDAPVETQSYQTSTLENVTIEKASSIHLHDATILGTTKMEATSSYHTYINIDLSEKSKKDTQLDLAVTYDWDLLREHYYYPKYIDPETDEATQAQEEFRKEHLEQMGIKAGSEYTDLKIEENKDGAKANHTPKDAPNKLIIRATNEQINLGAVELSH